ncbi:MAG: lysophospholipid acyltransferase family protein, partial [Acidimicrobiales bacterium]
CRSDGRTGDSQPVIDRGSLVIPSGIGRYQSVARTLLKPLVLRLWDLQVDGLENVPSTGPALLCPNHAAAIDSAFVPAVLDRNLIYVGKSEYLDDWKTRWLLPALGMIPIDRRGGDHATAALDAARAVLDRGDLFGIYPEGTRSRSGKLHKGHTGAARLAIETGAPIIPVGLTGTAQVQPVDSVLPKFGRRVGIRFGRPIPVDRYRNRIGDRAVYRELIDDVMYDIQQLTGLGYVNVYAGAEPDEVESETAPAVPVPVTVPVPTRPTPDATNVRPLSSEVLTTTPLVPLDELLAAS